MEHVRALPVVSSSRVLEKRTPRQRYRVAPNNSDDDVERRLATATIILGRGGFLVELKPQRNGRDGQGVRPKD